MSSIHLDRMAKSMLLLRRNGFEGPLMADANHPLFSYERNWRDHSTYVSSVPMFGTTDNMVNISRDDLRSTNAITNQHGAIIMDTRVEVEVDVTPRSQISEDDPLEHLYHRTVKISRFDLYLVGSLIIETVDTVSFKTQKGDNPDSLMLMRDSLSFNADVHSGKVSDAFKNFTEDRLYRLSKSPVFFRTSMDTTLATVRINAGTEPFFYALSKSEHEKMNNAMSSKHPRTYICTDRGLNPHTREGDIINAARNHLTTALSNMATSSITISEDGALTLGRGKSREDNWSLFNARRYPYSFGWTVNFGPGVSEQVPLTELVLNFLFTGIRDYSVDEIEKKADTLIPVFLDGGE